jgi:coenzyme F420-dependent glucose-6-phosphate dehydrogenase
MMQEFEAGAREAGKNPSDMPRLIELNVAYTENEQEAIECVLEYWAGTFVPALFDQKIYTPKLSAQNGAVVGPETVKKKMCLSANPDDHVQYARGYLDLGFTTLFYHCAGPDQTGFLQAYGRDVLPKLRQAVSKAA